MDTERRVVGHYTRDGLEGAILQALAAAGKDPDRLTPEDLAPVEELHTGGRQATVDLAARMGLSPGMHLLDVGSGVGGAARYFAREHGCRVTGIDLTEEYVRVASALTRRVGLDGSVSFRQGSALALPFPEGSFDGACMLHVGMNVADKAALFADVRRVLRPGAVFAVYDVMRLAPGALDFPLPWASAPETSFVEEPAAYRRALQTAGFAVAAERTRRDFALESLRRVQARMAAEGSLPVLGPHILVGEDHPRKIANLTALVERGLISPVEIVARVA
jgi:ubiquinone/menaquinone biosynthesis C-methylase UbiE